MVTAHKRRKGSIEDMNDCPLPQKKARVFFTEDQREHLRKAYTHDPYPNQARIEQLATELAVSTKTIINWFHNHRMRSKPRNMSPNGSGSSSVGDYHVKAEPQDELSNQSTTASSDPGTQVQGQESKEEGGGSQPGMSQWMFPQFEPVPVKRSRSQNSTDKESNISGIGSGKCSPVTDSVIKVDKESKESKSKEDINDENLAASPVPGTTNPTVPDTQKCSVSRRKSTCPQWAYEGVHLDRSLQADCPMESPLPSASPSTEGRQSATPNSSLSADPSEPIKNEGEGKANSPEEGKRKDKIEKLQQAVISADLDWEEVDRQENIEKLQKNLTQHAEETWAF